MPRSSPFELIMRRQEDAVMDLIDAGVFDIDTIEDDHGASLLHFAIQFKCNELSLYLVEKGCDVNGTETAQGHTPLDTVLEVNPGFTKLIDLIRAKGGLRSVELPSSDDEED
jgi:ankyrin repeat protein